ncbi:MAG: energy transducer TonB [Pseudomonadota bacterium]
MFLTASAIIHAAILFPLTLKSIGRNPPAPQLFAVDLVTRPRPLVQETTQQRQVSAPSAVLPEPEKTSRETPAVKAATAASPKKTFQPLSALPVGKEATVSLYADNKKHSKYSSYLRHLRQKIDSAWEYPASAKERGIEGELRVLFSIEKTGGLLDVKLLQSSGNAVLDQEALRTLHSAAPFNPLPSSLSISRLNVHASFKYQFSSD